MKTSFILKRSILALILIYSYAVLVSFDEGIVGLTMKNGTKLGCVCHGLQPDNRVAVTISGPSTMFVNEAAVFKLRIAGGPAVAGGCNIGTQLGDIFPSPFDTSLKREEQFPGAGFELTHKEPKLFVNDTVEFEFTYTAPPAPGVVDTIFANGNSTDYNGTEENDRWNFAESFLINVIERPLPVKLIAFTASAIDNNVTLKWATEVEENNQGFEIERKKISNDWAAVGFVNGHGNSSAPLEYSFTDIYLSQGKYNYRLKQIDFNGNIEYFDLRGEVEIGIPSAFKLSQNFPNPFNPATSIQYQLTEAAGVSLKIYDLNGREVMAIESGFKDAGFYIVNINSANLGSGNYFYRLEAGNFSDTKKMTVIK